MSDIYDFFTRKKMENVPVLSGVVAADASILYEENLSVISQAIGRPSLLDDRFRPELEFIDVAEPVNDFEDGTIHVLRGDTNQPTVIVVSNNVTEFFRRNGRENEESAIKDATLYATSLGFASISLARRRLPVQEMGFNARLWNYINIGEPRVAVPYRFASGLMLASGRGIPSRKVNIEGKTLTPHVVSFVNPLTISGCRDIASSHFKSH